MLHWITYRSKGKRRRQLIINSYFQFFARPTNHAEPVLNFVFLDFLSGGVELFVETNHKLTHRLFPVMNRHRPALADIA